MDFALAWVAFNVGDNVTVSTGKPPPSTNVDGVPFKTWRSNNFTGTLAEKIDGEWRKMRFELPPLSGGSVIGYVLVEGAGHTFEAA